MTQNFKTTAEYRHWICRHDFEDGEYPQRDIENLLRVVADVLPVEERANWGYVCSMYSRREFPDWFINEVGELNDY